MKNWRFRFFVSLVIAAMATVAVPGAASAATDNRNAEEIANNRLAQIKTRSDTAVRGRIEQINKLKGRVHKAKRLTDVHRVALETELAMMTTELEALNATIQTATELEAARTDAHKIVTSFRIYMLETPKVNQIVALDAVLTAADRLQQGADQLSKAFDALQASGKDVTSGRAAVIALNSKIKSIRDSVSTRSDAVVALSVNDYPGNRSVIQDGRSSIATARDQIKSARNDMLAIARTLK